MQVQIKIKNLPQVRAALMKSPAIVSKHINLAIEKAIKIDLNTAKNESTPIKSGSLRSRWEMKFSNLKGEFWPTMEYAVPVHEGHRQQVGRFVPAIGKRLVQPFVQGNPYLRNAIDMSMSAINRRFETGLKDSLNEIAKNVDKY